MPNKTVDSIIVVGDGLNAINFCLSNMMPGTEDFKKLKEERNRVRERFDIMVEFFIITSTKRFIAADSELAQVNTDMKAVLEDLADMQKTFDNVSRFITAIDTFITSVFA
jgi:hypothetical protein